MYRTITILLSGIFVAVATQEARAQYYIPPTVPIYNFTQPAPIVYYSVPRYEYRYYPRWRYRSFYRPFNYNVYIVPPSRTQSSTSPSTTTRERPSGVHPSQYLGNPHASQYFGDPHASQTLP